ncbi:cytosolic Fe-S cluster assembly factor NUBP2 homolog [Anneissia japonica]|uniref:cytosolic Fe-S cluster assembly factor NUBP2 homolog n=1 Tax=Anneissia japonica TaxID=1529436 RepID=UPI001425840B|nr:cytosolic Fe-S cluster assembly factor NUBP2 homolog [Anneissia japonica]
MDDDYNSGMGCPSESSLAGRAKVCDGCPGKALCQKQGGVDPDQEMINLRMNAIKYKILILSGKGGVGKSSIAVGLSISLAQHSNKVGLVDVDICGPSISKLMAVEGAKVVNTQYGWTPLKSPHEDVKVMSVGNILEHSDNAIIWRGPRKTQLIKRFIKDTFWGRLDYILFDTPPGTSDEHLTVVSALKNVKPEGAIIVTTPQQVALTTIRKEINFCRKMGIRIIGIVENMSGYVCPCCQEVSYLFQSGGAEKLADEYGLKLLGKIPVDSNLTACAEEGSNLFTKHPDSPASIAFRKIATELETTLPR